MEEAGAGASHSASLRFLAFCGEPASLTKWLLSLIPVVDRPERLNRILTCVDLVVYASPETRFILLEPGQGVLLEAMLGHRAPSRPADQRRMAEALYRLVCGDLAGPGPPDGGYVAFVQASGQVGVLRGPTGAVSVYYCEATDVSAFFSHAEICRQFDRRGANIHELEAGIWHWFSTGRSQDRPG
jgi:hypothetical protein